MKKNFLKVVVIASIVILSASVLGGQNANASPKVSSDKVNTKEYNQLLEKIDKEIDKQNQKLDKKNYVANPQLDKLKEELYQLVNSNQDIFGAVVTDANKMDALEQNPKLRALPQWLNYGDIFVTRTDLWGEDEKSFTGHAGIGDYDKGWTVESFPSNGNGVQFRSRYSSWRNDPNAGLYRPYGVSIAEYKDATDYSINQIGSSYNYTFNSAGAGFYCSELVYYAWKNASGLKLRTNTLLGDSYIWPGELADSPDTYKIAWPY